MPVRGHGRSSRSKTRRSASADMQDPENPKVRSRVVVLDTSLITDERLRKKTPLVRRVFARNLAAAVFVSLNVVSLCTLQILNWDWYTLFFWRGLLFLRTGMLLFLTISVYSCLTVNVEQLYGNYRLYQSYIALRAVPLLLFWHMLRILDLFIGRLVPLALNLIRNVSEHAGPDIILPNAGIDILVILAYFVELYLVEVRAIRLNVRKNILTVQKEVM